MKLANSIYKRDGPPIESGDAKDDNDMYLRCSTPAGSGLKLSQQRVALYSLPNEDEGASPQKKIKVSPTSVMDVRCIILSEKSSNKALPSLHSPQPPQVIRTSRIQDSPHRPKDPVACTLLAQSNDSSTLSSGRHQAKLESFPPLFPVLDDFFEDIPYGDGGFTSPDLNGEEGAEIAWAASSAFQPSTFTSFSPYRRRTI